MNWQDRYDGLPFTREQVDELGKLLRLTEHTQARAAAGAITRMLALYDLERNAKKRMGPTDKVAGRLAQIASAAATLSALLQEEALFRTPGEALFEALGSHPELEGLDRKPLWGDRTVSLEDLRKLIDNLAISSTRLANDDSLMRGYYFLPSARHANNYLETAVIWPTLFAMWEQHGHRVAGSVNGTNPLHRFVNLIHAAAGLEAPRPDTLNRAVQRWKRDPRRSRADNAVWYFGPPPANSDAMADA